MADQKVSDLPSLNGADVDAADLLYIIDSSAGSAGSKKITVGQYQLAPVSAGTANGVVYLNASKVATAGSDLVFDGSQLGLGTTPSAWSGVRALQIGAQGSIASFGNQMYVKSNNYFDGANDRYIASNFATDYYQQNGAHIWRTAPSGTAGNAISFTQVMSLQTNGVLALGAATPAINIGSSAVSTGDCSIEIGPGRSGNGNAYIDLTGDTTYTDYGLRIIRNNGGPNTASTIVHRGTGDLQLTCSEAAAITFGTSGAECARINSAGHLLVGTTGQYSGSTARQAISYTGSTSLYGLTLNAESTSNTTAIVFNVGGTNAGSGGTVVGTITNTSTATAYNTSSDYRLKNNPQTLTGSGAFIDALQPKTWEWAADGSRGVGFIAHEAQAVSPSSVVGEKDAVDADGKPVMQAMEYGSAEFIANIVAELKSLRARVAALESA